jgi:DNA-binding response OmpR family regulator
MQRIYLPGHWGLVDKDGVWDLVVGTDGGQRWRGSAANWSLATPPDGNSLTDPAAPDGTATIRPVGPGGEMARLGDETDRPVVLLADDEEAITANLAPFLERSGFVVHVVHDGEAALSAADSIDPDLCVLDVLMPRVDGREVLRRLRRDGQWCPVLLLTEVGEAGERAMALEEGADDYLNKPFDPHELVARIRAVLRRARPGRPPLSTAGTLRSGKLRFDRIARRAWLGDAELALTPKALTLLDYLLTHPDELLSRERLLEVLWGFTTPVGTRAVDNRVAELRRLLGDDPTDPTWIETVSGLGYRFCGSVDGS